VFAQKNIYENVNFEQLSQNHKLLAILPFSSQVNLSTNVDTKTKTSLEINEEEAVQDAWNRIF